MIGVSTIKELSTTKVEGYTWDCVNVYVGYKKKKEKHDASDRHDDITEC